MSYNWCLHSFRYDKYVDALAEQRQRIVDAVLDEVNESDGYAATEVQRYIVVGREIIASGFSYDGLDATDTKVMDRFVFDSFHTLGDSIDFAPLSSEFLSPYVTSDLPSHLFKKHFFSRSRPIPEADREYFLLPFFTHLGRRLGQDMPSDCEYVALEPAEVVAIEKELVKFLGTDEGRSLDQSSDNNLSRDFLEPVRSALEAGCALHAQVS
ncbi:MAG: hypothetical protein AAFN07_06705 [Pseudomonadota bacterium]